jgi:hypothetical protein
VQLEDGALFKGSIEMDPAKVVKQDTRMVSKKVGASSRAGLSIKDSGNGAGPAPVKNADTKESGLTLKSG